VGFYDVHDIGSTSTVTFEIVLHEGSNVIEILYGLAQMGLRDMVAGIQDEDGTIGLEIQLFEIGVFNDGDTIFDREGFLLTPNGVPTCAGLDVTILGGSGPDVLTGTPGDDVILAGDGPDVVVAGGGDDVICGGPGADSLDGGPGNDRIIGEEGNDTISGGGGKDRLIGGRGADVCDGGRERDRASTCGLKRRIP